MRIIKKIIKIIFSAILTISILLYILINLLSSTILKESYVLSKLDQANFYQKVYEEVNSNFEKYIYQSGFDENVLNNVITEEKVKEDFKIIIDNIYNGTNQDINTETIKTNLTNNINSQLGANISKIEQNSIDSFVDTILNEYTQTILHTQYENKINKAYTQINKYINLANKALLIIMAVLIILLILLNLKRLYRGVSYIGISMLSSGILLCVADIFIKMKVDIKNIVILNDTISKIIINVITELLANILKDGIILLVSGIVLIIIANLRRAYKKYKYEQSKYNAED